MNWIYVWAVAYVALLVIAGIWVGGWRWYATAGVLALPAMVLSAGAIPEPSKKDTAKWN